MMRHRRFLATVAAIAIVATAAWTALFYAMLGTRTPVTTGRCDAALFKRTIGNLIPSPKLVIVAGSSSIDGINAEMISASVGMPVLNMGLFAAFGPEILLNEAKQTLRAGDTALIAVEYNAYAFEGPTAPAIDFILGCGEDLFRAMPLKEKAQYVFGLDLARVVETLQRRQYQAPDAEGMIWRPESLTQLGDKRLEPRFFPPLSAEDQQRMALYQPTPIDFNEEAAGVQSIRDFVQWARQNDVRVLATWPNTIYFPSYENNPGFAKIGEFYRSLGVAVVGNPVISWMPREMFYDTQYHLTIRGIIERTRMLIPPLKQALTDTNPPVR